MADGDGIGGKSNSALATAATTTPTTTDTTTTTTTATNNSTTAATTMATAVAITTTATTTTTTATTTATPTTSAPKAIPRGLPPTPTATATATAAAIAITATTADASERNDSLYCIDMLNPLSLRFISPIRMLRRMDCAETKDCDITVPSACAVEALSSSIRVWHSGADGRKHGTGSMALRLWYNSSQRNWRSGTG
ncbi:bypass of stop codon protein 1-like [Penaeus japonicus]|uniref:bypass of stop codon protein 1-like n=1 Tax=Penaeus japonicus TaxID=27405 RepID=UPI001C71454D|nr:bypass of stop codon protein 1-like [Penaeus japonicus]